MTLASIAPPLAVRCASDVTVLPEVFPVDDERLKRSEISEAKRRGKTVLNQRHEFYPRPETTQG
jgi:hypothetical protein